MGIGADTIEALAEGPYRRRQEMRAVAERRIKVLVELHRLGVRDSSASLLALDWAPLDAFEAVASAAITSEEGAWLLGLQRMPRPWYVRLAVWLWSARRRGEAGSP